MTALTPRRAVVLMAVMYRSELAQAQCPGGKTGYSDATCAATQDDQLDAAAMQVVADVQSFVDAIKAGRTCNAADGSGADCAAGTADESACTDLGNSDCSWGWDGSCEAPLSLACCRCCPAN